MTNEMNLPNWMPAPSAAPSDQDQAALDHVSGSGEAPATDPAASGAGDQTQEASIWSTTEPRTIDQELDQLYNALQQPNADAVEHQLQLLADLPLSGSGSGDPTSQSVPSDISSAPDPNPLPSDPNSQWTMDPQYQALQHDEVVNALLYSTPDPFSLTPSEMNQLQNDPQQFAADHGLAYPPEPDPHDM